MVLRTWQRMCTYLCERTFWFIIQRLSYTKNACSFTFLHSFIRPSVDSSSFDAPIHVNLFFAIVCYWPCWNIFWIYHIAWTTIFSWQTFTRLRLNSTTNIIERYLHFDIELNFYPFQGLLIHYYLLFFWICGMFIYF